MADSVASEQQVTELVGNLTLEDQPKARGDHEGPVKEESGSETKLAVSSSSESGVSKENKTQLNVKDHRPFYPSNNYYGYYYPGHDPAAKEWEDQSRFAGLDGIDVQYPGVPSDNGSVLYYPPGYAYGQNPYNPYNPFIPGAMVGADAQYMGQRPYYGGQFPQSGASGYYHSLPMHQAHQETGSLPLAKPNANGSSGGKGLPKTAYKDGFKGAQTGASLPRNYRPMSQIQLNHQHGPGPFPPKDSMQFRKLTPGFNHGKVMISNGSVNGMGYKPNGRPRGKVYGFHYNENWNFVGLNEQNRGPRTNKSKVYHTPSDGKDTEDNGSSGDGEAEVGKDQYNLESFPVEYESAKFFVIKSYSEDDVHQSIKYNVWASTPNGNKRLDGAYEEAQKHFNENNKECPVFLFFSVNASGQFCGVAEMTGSVDFEKSMDFWQQDKWNGFFPVKWHMIKDIPNSHFRQIILENNDNKPVTNSRDTQEIKFEQGIEMLKIFKNYALKTSILDDFSYYEGRQKAVREKKQMQQSLQRQFVTRGGVSSQRFGEDGNIRKCSDNTPEFNTPPNVSNCHKLPDNLNDNSGQPGDKKDTLQVQEHDSTESESEVQVENPRVLIVGSVAC
eukprot:TRINITY_DN3876_c0_g3_i2.p1 TRINITY_DN3876_c0_g3~~TRINITY_DN3876_c0_g3_i2.p1  ORF type:complete len:614 (-),score=83.14 TRINITY_DN3876_c0_g3_i2:158-1999(-)